jgi:heme/copper-type cytochrome/quinol oxidase subunit 1
MVVMSPTGDIAVAGTAFFTSDLGGSPMMYWNMVWMWGIRKSTC